MKKIIPYINFVFLLGILAFILFEKYYSEKVSFREIEAERVSIVGENGNLYLSLSNPTRQALPTINGELIDSSMKSRNVPGLIFFNSQGDEVGGLIYDADDSSSAQYFTFDQYKEDQIMVLAKDEMLIDGEWRRWYGLYLRERSDELADSPYRMFLGREENEQVGLFLYDSKSRPRLKFYIDEFDTPRIEMLDSTGMIIENK